MVITYHGEGTFRIQSGEMSILLNPTGNRLKGDVILRTSIPTDSEISTGPDFGGAGEYEVRGVEIRGVAVPEESTEKVLKTVYVVHWEDISLVLFGDLKKTPSATVLDHIDEPDIVLLALGTDTLSAPEAAHLVKQIEPGIAIASHEGSGGFEKAFGQKVQPEEKLVIKKKDIVSGAGRLVILKNV